MTWTLLRSFNSSSAPSLANPDLVAYLVDKPVRISYVRDGLTVNIEGKVGKANPFAILLESFRNKTVTLIEADWLRSVEELEPKISVPKIVVRQLGPIDIQVVRQHLADRHGVPLSGIDSDPAEALKWHTLHHQAERLGHQHGDTKPRSNSVSTPQQIAERARDLDSMLVCDSCGYRRRPEEDGKIMQHTADLVMHCEDCKDDKEFTYV